MKENIYSSEFVKKLFNSMSASYERMNIITSFGFSIRWRRQFVKRIKSSKQKPEVLDLLCGMGETWQHIYSIWPDAKITALDFSEEMVNRAKTNSKRTGSEIEFKLEDLLDNSLPSDHFDTIVCGFGLKTFTNEQLKHVGAEVQRLLKPGGSFSFVDVSKPSNPLLVFFYSLYMGKVIPILGKLFLGNPSDYKMLWKYTEKFGNSKIAGEMFSKSGLEVEYHSYFFGCATGISGKKSLP